MRIQVAGSPLAGRRLALTAGVVVALALSMGGAAWAAPIAERTYSESSAPAAAPVVAERSYSGAPAVAATPAPAESVAVVPTTDDGIGALVIALIAFGGVLAIGGFAFIGVRVAHHGHAAH
jgi:methyl coenzyme M reductase subunit C